MNKLNINPCVKFNGKRLVMLFKEFSKNVNPYKFKRIKQLQKQLQQAESYEEWKSLALKLDDVSGACEWKYDNTSTYFDASVISTRLNLLKRYKTAKRGRDLMHVLHEGLSYDVANIAHPMLFTATYIGTKKIIEDYIVQVSECLAYIASSECHDISLEEKINFFQESKVAYGQPAIMFSGGASLGLFHTGVCKALYEQDLMPSVLSGSSAGAIMTAMLGVSKPADIEHILNGENFFDEAFKFRSWKDILQGNGGLADVRYLKNFLRENLGDLTFREAFEQSGLYINVAIAPYEASQDARIMNKFTSPDVLVWSAVLASCAVPVLFPPVKLTSKRYDGKYTSYMANTKWVDGSVRSDFPQEKMARLYNLSYTIASQVNPHIVPFMQSDEERYRKDVLSWPERIIRRQGVVISRGMMDFARERAERMPTIRRLLDYGYGIMDQRYYGDVNIIGDFNFSEYRYMLQNPKKELFKLLQKEGERATWPKISAIEAHARVGKTIHHCLESLYVLQRQEQQ
jgi:predicted acylesterase/phospholipase RssA